MFLNFPRFIRDLARLNGVPEPHLSAIVHRFLMAKRARDQLDEYQPVSSKRRISADLHDIEREIDAADLVLARRILAKSVDDYRQGVLERRC